MLLTIATIAGLSVCAPVESVAPCPLASPFVVEVQAESRWGVFDAEALAALERDLLMILEGPVENTRGGTLSEEDQWAIEFDPELHEAYRAAPKATLELIQRIRDAGGLSH